MHAILLATFSTLIKLYDRHLTILFVNKAINSNGTVVNKTYDQDGDRKTINKNKPISTTTKEDKSTRRPKCTLKKLGWS